MINNGKGTIKVQEWFFDKVNAAAHNYGISLIGEYINRPVVGHVLDHTVFRVDEIVGETEKAIRVVLDAETYGGSYKGWTTWIPKSVIVEM